VACGASRRVDPRARAREGPDRRGWFDVDRKLALPEGATLAALIEQADRDGLRLSQAIEASPHLRHTLMWNGERTPVDENLARELRDGDELYLLGPVAGG
jgi:molybdopterin converting factor small subunit